MVEGIISHNLASYKEVEELPERLRTALAPLALLHLLYWGVPLAVPEPAWHIGVWGPPRQGLTPRHQWESGQGPMLYGPEMTPLASSWLVFGRRCLFVTTGVKWWAAMDRLELFRQARDYLHELALALDSRAFVLHRENGSLSWDWVLDGMTFKQIEDKLRSGGAEPVTDLEALRRTGSDISRTNYYRKALYEKH